MGKFYCGSCGKFKDDSLKMKRKSGKTPICATCNKKAAINANAAEHSMNAKRKRAAMAYKKGKMWFPD